MERMILCFCAALIIWLAISLLSSPIKLGLKFLLNMALGLVALWVFNRLGVHIGITLGLNLINAAVVAIFGPAGIVMLLFLRFMGL